MSLASGGGVQVHSIPTPQGPFPPGLQQQQQMPGVQTPTPGAGMPGGAVGGGTPGGVGMQMVAMQPPGGGASISLGLLLEHLVQKTYHELMILSELLPRKMDMERKIEIVKFARSTRQSFIRLLALVKWAGSAAKVDKCAAISSFLDQQSLLFVDTADMLSRMARENLVHARLPNFCLPHAVDVLTMRQYKRMPACIKERIVPPDPITTSEKETVLHRLDQIIQHRLVTSDQLPPQLANLTIEDGRVKFRVPQEFEVTLTLMEDNRTIPWRLLNIDILVQDPDTGEGKALVHPLQVNYIHQLVQSRLFGDDKPLVDMYNVLHTFCQSLQLEVLYSQAQRLISERWGEHVLIDKYTAGESLIISYWRSQGLHTSKPAEFYKMTVSIDGEDVAKPLQVSHDPSLEMVDAKQVNQAIKCDHLSIERLLVETVLVRSRVKLKELQGHLEKDLPGFKTNVEGTPALLCIPVVAPCSSDEQLVVSVDMQTGSYSPSITHCDAGLLEEIEHSLNYDRAKLEPLVTKLRIMLFMRHCRFSVSMLPVTFLKDLPLVPLSPEHPLRRLLPHHFYLRLIQHPQFYLVVDFQEGKGVADFQCRYHLLHCTQMSYVESQTTPQGGSTPTPTDGTNTAETYLNPDALVDLDHSTIIRGPDTPIESLEVDEENKRKSYHEELFNRKKKKMTSHCEFFNHQLAHIVSLCNIRIPFIKLCEELASNNLSHQGIQVEGEGVGLVVKLCALPSCNGVPAGTSTALRGALLDCSIRLHKNQHGMWQVQLVFANCPVSCSSSKEQGPTRLVYLHYKVHGSHSVVRQLLRDWDSIGHLYQLTLDLPMQLPYLSLTQTFRASWISDNPLASNADIISFTYQKLTIAYGKDRTSTVTVFWDPDMRRFRMVFGAVGSTSSANCHTVVLSYLEHELNLEKSLPKLIKTLCESQSTLHAICKLPLMPSLGLAAATNQVFIPMHKFALLPQSSTHYRLVFHNAYCLDIHCKGKSTVAVRDGAFSLFDMRKVVDGMYPVQGLKFFLELFIDDAVSFHQQHRNSRTLHSNEDDANPLSPMVDSGPTPPDPYLPQVPTAYPPGASPMSRGGFAYPMTPPTAPGGPGSSNPATPASPHPPLASQQYTMSPGAYPLASPPSIPGPSPSSVMKGTPSPGLPEGGSPFTSMGLTMPSPGSRQWPGSPSMPGPSPVQRFGMAPSPGSMATNTHSPGSSGMTGQQGQILQRQSRVLPPRNLHTSLPTILSHDALNRMFTPAAIPGTPVSPTTYLCAPIERFLGSTYLQRHLKRALTAEQTGDQAFRSKLATLQSTDQGFHFNNESLVFRLWLNSAHMQQLHLQVKKSPDAKEIWSNEELQVIERYFENKVACPPFKPKAITSLVRMLSATAGVFKDLIKLMHLELQPDPSLKWTMQLCLTVPQGGQSFAPAGIPAGIPAVVIKSKMLLFIQLTRQDQAMVPMTGHEPPVVVVPILYDIPANTTQHISAIKTSMHTNQNDSTIANMLRRWAEFHNNPECTLFPAIRDLMANLNLPM